MTFIIIINCQLVTQFSYSLSTSYVIRIMQSTPGDLTVVESEDEVLFRLRNQEPIRYRIDFPTVGVVPKLTKVSVNGVVVCRSSPCKLYLIVV